MTATRVIDLNADLGEGVGDDEALLAIVTSANVACGAHAGDEDTMRRTCELAAAHGVVVGAHPGYDDPEHFGRRALDVPLPELAESLAAQLAALRAIAAEAGSPVQYVKAHGALYHRAAVDTDVAEAVYREGVACDPSLRFLVPPGSLMLRFAARADHGVRGIVEGFADRAYATGPGGHPTLVDRAEPGAILDHDAALAQAVSLATTGTAQAVDGTTVHVRPRSLCVHGDTPGAVDLARDIRRALESAGVAIRSFAR
ncbi:MAG: 5-oxoprolinase subunit PxpA [Solirubrobacteraceae bacterium]|nr:5-oxoprolinase subunit PxpA [Patulibacter sp.]